MADPLRISALSFNGGTVSITWSAIAGRTYRILYKDDLASAVWLQLGDPLPATGPSVSTNDSLPPNTHRFYRVIRSD